MLRWLTRLAVGALIVALLFWLWTRYNEDLEEDELEEEIPLEFEVAADAGPALPLHSDAAAGLPVSTGSTATTERLPAAEAEPSAPVIPGALTEPSTNGATPAADAPGDTASARALTDDDEETVPPTLGPRPKGEQEGHSFTEHDDALNAPPPGAGDNLIVIKGIGPKYGAQLAEMGITTFGALIATQLDDLIMAFPRVGEAELADWIAQARELDAHDA